MSHNDGLLLLDKPLGLSSNHALQRVKRLLGATKAGHTGSLDPLATGMLPICLGEATKFTQYLLNADKTYLVTAQLGVTTTTGDREGSVLSEVLLVDITRKKIEEVLKQFSGEIEQCPTAYSALKYQGKPYYHYARKGIEIERKSRLIKIHEIKLLGYTAPFLKLEIACSKGTYIRTLIEDIGAALNCGATVEALHRTRVGEYHAEQMITLAALENATQHAHETINHWIQPIEGMLEAFPSLQISYAQAIALRQGQVVQSDSTLTSLDKIRLYYHQHFLGLGSLNIEGQLIAERLLAYRHLTDKLL